MKWSIFKKKNEKKQNYTQIINESAVNTNWVGNAYANDIFRAGVDAIARNAAKMVAISKDEKIAKKLNTRPNNFMSGYDFLYKLFSQLYSAGNAFALWDGVNLYPIDYSAAQMLSDEQSELYAQFTLIDGEKVIFQYSKLIHLRRFFNEDRLLGSDNTPLNPAVILAQSENEACASAMQSGRNIRGLLKMNEIMRPDDLERYRDKFLQQFYRAQDVVLPLDPRADFIPLSTAPVILSAEQSAQIRAKIYNYLGINERIVSGDYNEDIALAFSESVIEPLSIQLGQELTAKIGTEINYDLTRLNFVTPARKVEMLRYILPAGILSVNQALNILSLPPISGGDVTVQSLNYKDLSRDVGGEKQ